MKSKKLLLFSLLFISIFTSTFAQVSKSGEIKFYKVNTTERISVPMQLNWLKNNLLKLSLDYDFKLVKTVNDNLGYTHYKYQEYFKGIKVNNAIYSIHTKNGFVESANGEYYKNIELDVLTVTPKNSYQTIYNKLKTQYVSKEVETINEDKSSCIHILNDKGYLVYKIELRSFEPLKHAQFLVNANNLSILQELNKIHTIDVPGTATTFYNGTKAITCDNTAGVYKLTESGRNIATKNCNNNTSLGSASDFTNTTSSFVGSTILTKSHFDLHYGLEKTYDYFSTKFGRTSWDNSGALVRGIDHYSSSYNNAFWSNPYMVFGDGDGSSYRSFATTDIIGHEFTHAVTESEAGLIYMNESGGLNESFSDIFGVCVDYYANPSTANFLEGEQCSLSGIPFRNMTNPKATFQPNTYQGQYWVPLNGPDNGGVHTNSQCQNFWFYLLANGGSGVNDNSNAYSITGIGISDAEKIAYRNLSIYLTPNSTFMDARNYAIQSAIDLFGACSNQVIQCTNAWYAVGLGSLYSNAVVAQFNSANNYACSLPATFTFTNQSTNGTTYAWDFGDGTTSTATNPSKTYTAAGTYNIKLKSTGTASCNTVDSITKPNYITVANIGVPISNCIPSQNTINVSYGISNVSFGAINKSSSNATEGYKDFTCTNQTTLTAGNPYQLSINTIYNYSKVYAWIDYNNDGIYNQTNELILSSSPSLATTTHSLIVFTPTNAVLNTPLRLRVYDDIVSVGGACNIHNQGQTEDYTVIFKAATAKPIPNFFTLTKNIAVGSNALFQDSSLNAPSSWKWTFQGASLATATSTLQNPTVNYPTVGTYSVKLVTTNSFGSDSTTKISYISVTNSFNMCQVTTSTSLANGTLYDSGGPTGNYLNNEYCSFLINPGCAGTGTVSLSFTQFQTDNSSDYLTVYSGSTTSSPLLGNYFSLPPVLTSTNGALLLIWYSNGFNNAAGYTANWTSTVAGSSAPVANFTVSNNNPPLNTAVTFSDQTTNAPISWNWQFSDGTSSTSMNPIKTFTTSGVQTITLTAANCNTLSTVIKTITVQAAPTISFSPNPITASVSCSGSVTVTGTISNGGSGALQYNILNSGSNTQGKNVLFITSYMGTSNNEYINMNTILSSIPNCTITQLNLSTPANLVTALVGKQVLVIPEFETIFSNVISTYSTVIQNFVTNGGVAVQCGNNQLITNEIGLFASSYMGNFFGSNMSVLDTTDMVTKTINLQAINALNATFAGTFSNLGITHLVKMGVNSSVLRRDIGLGRAIFLGYDYFQTDVNASKILVNAVTRTSTNIGLPWLSITPTSGTVAAGSSNTISLNFSSANLAAGIYTSNLVINSNSPTSPSLSIPISYSVVGTANASVSVNCLNFGSIMQYTSKKDSVTYYNTGCATLTVSTISATNSAYSYTPSTSFTVAPWSNRKIYVTFNPQTVGSFPDTLYINSNGGNRKVCLTGSSSSAPSITTSPTSLTFNLAACNASQTSSLNILNTGGSNLNYTVYGSSPASSTVNVLVITNLTNTFSTEYLNTVNAITSNFSGANIINHSLTTVASLTNALQNCKVLLFPEQANYYYGVMQPFTTSFTNFVNAGGTAIICAAYNQTQLSEIGLLNASSFFYNQNVAVVDTNDVIMKGLPMGPIVSPSSNIGLTITSANTVDYVKSGGLYSLVSKRTLGLGHVVYIGTDFFNTNVNFGKIIANTVRSSASSFPSWLSTSSSTAGVVSPSASSVFNVTAYSANLSAGTYTYNVLINSNDPLNPAYSVPITINVGTNPCANFVFNNANNCSGAVTFTQTAINTISTYSWNFGNNTSSSLQNPSCTYANAGTYSVSLTVCNGTQCSTATKTLNISNVGGPISASCVPTSYSLSGNQGIINVSLNTINKSSNAAYTEGYQDFSCLNQTNLTIGTNYTLTVSTPAFLSENVAAWIDFNNDGIFTPSEQVLNSINKVATHTVVIAPPTTAILNTPLRMRIIDEWSGYTINSACYQSYYGQCEDYTVKILSPTAPPVANFSQSVNSCQGTVNFTDNTIGNPTSWIWNFGDGGASSQQNPTYTYANPGTYTVTLLAFNPFGNSAQTSVVTVNPLSFSINIGGTQAVGQPLAFSSTYTNATIYNWNFGNGALSGSQNPIYTYTSSGVYTVSLTILAGACITTKTETVNISSTTGLNKWTSNNTDFSLAPNPASNELILRSNRVSNNSIYFKLYNSLGEIVLMKEINGAVQEEKISISYLANGIYFAKIDCGDKQQVIKLVKE